MDIKYVPIHGTSRNVLLLTVIDIYSRKVLIYQLRTHIHKGDVMMLLSLMLLEYKAEGMSIRNDNGSQFIAHAVRDCLKDKGYFIVNRLYFQGQCIKINGNVCLLQNCIYTSIT